MNYIEIIQEQKERIRILKKTREIGVAWDFLEEMKGDLERLLDEMEENLECYSFRRLIVESIKLTKEFMYNIDCIPRDRLDYDGTCYEAYMPHSVEDCLREDISNFDWQIDRFLFLSDGYDFFGEQN